MSPSRALVRSRATPAYRPAGTRSALAADEDMSPCICGAPDRCRPGVLRQIALAEATEKNHTFSRLNQRIDCVWLHAGNAQYGDVSRHTCTSVSGPERCKAGVTDVVHTQLYQGRMVGWRRRRMGRMSVARLPRKRWEPKYSETSRMPIVAQMAECTRLTRASVLGWVRGR